MCCPPFMAIATARRSEIFKSSKFKLCISERKKVRERNPSHCVFRANQLKKIGACFLRSAFVSLLACGALVSLRSVFFFVRCCVDLGLPREHLNRFDPDEPPRSYLQSREESMLDGENSELRGASPGTMLGRHLGRLNFPSHHQKGYVLACLRACEHVAEDATVVVAF